MSKKFLKVLLSSAMTVSMLAACGSGGGAGGSGSELAEGDTVKIGGNFELSGDVASYGTAESNAVELAIKMYNESEDAKYKLEYVSVDNKGDAAESTTAATKLIEEDQVAFIVGPATSGASIATYQVASDSSVPVISPSATQINATMNGDEVYPSAFRICFEDSYQGAAMAQYAAKDMGKKKAAVLAETSDYGQGLANQFIESFEANGGEVINSLKDGSYNAGDTDFNAILTKLSEKDFDVLYVAGYYGEAGLIIKQAREMGIDATIVGADGFDSTVLAQLAGKENLNDVFFTTAIASGAPTEAQEEFKKAYIEEYGEDALNMFSYLAYDSVMLGIQALEEAGATGPALQEALEKAEFDGLTGSFTFDETHTPVKSVLVIDAATNGAETNAEVTVK